MLSLAFVDNDWSSTNGGEVWPWSSLAPGPGPPNVSTSGAGRAVLGEEFPADQFSAVIEAISVTVSGGNINGEALVADVRLGVFLPSIMGCNYVSSQGLFRGRAELHPPPPP